MVPLVPWTVCEKQAGGGVTAGLLTAGGLQKDMLSISGLYQELLSFRPWYLHRAPSPRLQTFARFLEDCLALQAKL